jgi:hypothetical protein
MRLKATDTWHAALNIDRLTRKQTAIDVQSDFKLAR